MPITPSTVTALLHAFQRQGVQLCAHMLRCLAFIRNGAVSRWLWHARRCSTRSGTTCTSLTQGRSSARYKSNASRCTALVVLGTSNLNPGMCSRTGPKSDENQPRSTPFCECPSGHLTRTLFSDSGACKPSPEDDSDNTKRLRRPRTARTRLHSSRA